MMKRKTINNKETKPMAHDTVLSSITQDNFKQLFKRLMRQLSERTLKVENKQKSNNYYQNKRTEFKRLIDTAIKQGWFTMPTKESRIWKIYYDLWD